MAMTTTKNNDDDLRPQLSAVYVALHPAPATPRRRGSSGRVACSRDNEPWGLIVWRQEVARTCMRRAKPR